MKSGGKKKVVCFGCKMPHSPSVPARRSGGGSGARRVRRTDPEGWTAGLKCMYTNQKRTEQKRRAEKRTEEDRRDTEQNRTEQTQNRTDTEQNRHRTEECVKKKRNETPHPFLWVPMVCLPSSVCPEPVLVKESWQQVIGGFLVRTLRRRKEGEEEGGRFLSHFSASILLYETLRPRCL